MNVKKLDFQGQWGTYRNMYISKADFRSLSAKPFFAGADEGDFRWMQSALKKDPSNIEVVYSALNPRDMDLFSGALGMEFAGCEKKRHIMGVIDQGGISSDLKTALASWEVPRTWTLQEAATVPIAYLSVYYALFNRFTVKKDQTIFINLDTGGIGLAAIRVALSYGLEVFTTCSNEESRKQILRVFTELKVSNINNAEESSYEEMIHSGTYSKGVDVVLNTCWNTDLHRLMGCVAEGGTLIDITESELSLRFSLVLNVSLIHARLNLNDPDLSKIIKMISIDIERNIVKPLPFTTFLSKDLLKGIDFIMNEGPLEKVLIKMRDESNNNDILPVPVVPRVYFSSDKFYIILTDLKEFDLELIDFLIQRGANKLFLNTKKCTKSFEYKMS